MKKFIYRMLTAAFIGTAVIMTSCDDEDNKPSAPQIIPDVSELSIIPDATKSFDVTFSAAGKIGQISAEADKGTVTVSDITGEGEATGKAKITYKAPAAAGDDIITITITDGVQQQKTLDVAVSVTQAVPVELAGGDVEGEWGPFKTYHVTGNLTVPAGKSLKVLEGTTIIVDGPYAVTVRGNFYSYGTAENQVLFTVPSAKRTKANIFGGLWGGVLASNATTTEMAVIYTRMEYVGLPGVAGTDIVSTGEVAEGAPTYALYFNNPNGKIVVMNSTFAYSVDVAVQINQGSLLVANNTFILNGQSGGESVNLKSGAVGDIAFNTFYAAATNGVKWSNSGDRTPQNNVNVYNNTAIGCGWRQTKSGRGGSFNLEKGGKGKVYNNMVINSKYGVKFPTGADAPDVANSAVGYNLYFGNNDASVTGFYPTEGSITLGSFETSHDVSGVKNANNPMFVSFDVSTFNVDAAKSSANADFPAAFNLRLQAGSPALNHGKTGFATNFTTLTVDGKQYTVPAPVSYIGAFGSN
ncbi:hypothetical protein KK083_17905 [Fulvivirgaceae bacterium PWU4]|uniref:Right-handed parallel beta-helix repeat-containing protein n=1 Tax=Chryseosolibacter histidini TaxID=2782349 RepID=A0AAP2DPV7_9BACT|nr:hypothetical protein [Chryseosolibacter histidini]MBT1698772.1 hypothetical protein [Chryseosolibacter histidini]